jgi:sorbitol-specific phosphotransferase system component IIA
MADADDGETDLAELGSQVLEILDDETVIVTLRNGKTVEGSPASFIMRKKAKKGDVSWSGRLSVETDSGVLEMDCGTIVSVKSK